MQIEERQSDPQENKNGQESAGLASLFSKEKLEEIGQNLDTFIDDPGLMGPSKVHLTK